MKKVEKKLSWHHGLGIALALIAPTAIPIACSRHLDECDGPPLNTSQLASMQRNLFSTGPGAFLVLPNPIEATNNVQAQASDVQTNQAGGLFNLSDLINPGRLESDFIKIRIHSIQDDVSTLAQPNAQGAFKFAVNDVHYSEVMAYFSVSAIVQYTQALGFNVQDHRPLYVLVRDTSSGNPQEVNAYYSHNYLDPTQPRIIRMIGDTAFAPAEEEDIPLHETGHNRNELFSSEVGIDFAGDNGATYTQAAGLHECLADYYSETFRNKGYIGKWIARNFPDFQPGQPLRSAVDTAGNTMTYQEVAEFDGTDKNLDRYRLGEWCTRALWQLRQQFVTEDPQNGAYYADRVIMTALGFLKKDTSLKDFQTALQQSDQGLHCGLHSESINQVFALRGYQHDVGDISTPLQISGSAVGVDANGNPVATTAQASQVVFNTRISNISGQTARNVRLYLESSDPSLIKISYMQGFGDLPTGSTVVIGNSTGSGLPYTFSVSAQIDQSAPRGSVIQYQLHVVIENGSDSVYQGTIQL